MSIPGFVTAAAEWWMLSFADFFVVSDNSGFGRTAAFHSLKHSKDHPVIYAMMSDSVANCSKDSYTPMEKLASAWSNI